MISIDDDTNCGIPGETFNPSTGACECGAGVTCAGNQSAPLCDVASRECKCTATVPACTGRERYCDVANHACTLGRKIMPIFCKFVYIKTYRCVNMQYDHEFIFFYPIKPFKI